MITLSKTAWAKLNADVIFAVSITVARLQMLFMAAVEGLSFMSSDPNVQAGINQLLPPKYIPWIFISLGIITELAHARRKHNDRDDTDTAPDPNR